MAYPFETFAEYVMSNPSRYTGLKADLVDFQGSQTWSGSSCQVNKATFWVSYIPKQKAADDTSPDKPQ